MWNVCGGNNRMKQGKSWQRKCLFYVQKLCLKKASDTKKQHKVCRGINHAPKKDSNALELEAAMSYRNHSDEVEGLQTPIGTAKNIYSVWVTFEFTFLFSFIFSPSVKKAFMKLSQSKAHKNISYLWKTPNIFRYCRMCFHIHITWSHAFLLNPAETTNDDVNTFIHHVFMFFHVVMFSPRAPDQQQQQQQLINPCATLVFVWIIYVDMGHASEHVYVAHFPRISTAMFVWVFLCERGKIFHLRFLFISVASKFFPLA